jgi:TonB family protein
MTCYRQQSFNSVAIGRKVLHVSAKIAAVALLFLTCADAQNSSVTAPERKAVPANFAARRLCGSTDGATTSDTQSATTRSANSPCGPVLHPLYPPEAKQEHIQGTVHLKAVIGTDGTIRELSVIDGHPLLAPAAIEAVRQWKYKPYFVKGKPVEMETTVTVNYTLQDGSAQEH